MQVTGSIRVVIIDDHEMFAESLGHLLADEADVELLGIASTARRGLDIIADQRPDLVLLDYRLPDGDGPDIAGRIKQDHPETRVVMLTAYPEEQPLLNAIDAGCVGFLTKDQAASEVLRAIRTASEEDLLISPQLLSLLVPKLRQKQQGLGTNLTGREGEVLELLAEGCSTQEIADRLVLSVHTVRNHVQSVITKLGASSKLQAVTIALREGLVRIPRSP